MGKQRKTWSIEEKLSIVLEVMQSQDSIATIAKRNGVNDQQIYKWKAAFIEGGKQGLTKGKVESADERIEAENKQLKELLGEKALQIEMLKKIRRLS